MFYYRNIFLKKRLKKRYIKLNKLVIYVVIKCECIIICSFYDMNIFFYYFMIIGNFFFVIYVLVYIFGYK